MKSSDADFPGLTMKGQGDKILLLKKALTEKPGDNAFTENSGHRLEAAERQACPMVTTPEQSATQAERVCARYSAKLSETPRWNRVILTAPLMPEKASRVCFCFSQEKINPSV